jgi:ribosome-associated protein
LSNGERGGFPIDPEKKVHRCAYAALDKKAADLVILDMQGISSFTDYFIICSGRSDRQVQGIASAIEMEMKKEGVLPLGIEGFTEGRWVLLDYDDVVVHVFYEPIRDFYDLENLWADAPRLELNS